MGVCRLIRKLILFFIFQSITVISFGHPHGTVQPAMQKYNPVPQHSALVPETIDSAEIRDQNNYSNKSELEELSPPTSDKKQHDSHKDFSHNLTYNQHQSPTATKLTNHQTLLVSAKGDDNSVSQNQAAETINVRLQPTHNNDYLQNPNDNNVRTSNMQSLLVSAKGNKNPVRQNQVTKTVSTRLQPASYAKEYSENPINRNAHTSNQQSVLISAKESGNFISQNQAAETGTTRLQRPHLDEYSQNPIEDNSRTSNQQSLLVSTKGSGNSVNQHQAAKPAHTKPQFLYDDDYQQYLNSADQNSKISQDNRPYVLYPSGAFGRDSKTSNKQSLFVSTTGSENFINHNPTAAETINTLLQRPHVDKYSHSSIDDNARTSNTQSLIVSAKGSGNAISQNQAAETVYAGLEHPYDTEYQQYPSFSDDNNSKVSHNYKPYVLYPSSFLERKEKTSNKQSLLVSEKESKNVLSQNPPAEIVNSRLQPTHENDYLHNQIDDNSKMLNKQSLLVSAKGDKNSVRQIQATKTVSTRIQPALNDKVYSESPIDQKISRLGIPSVEEQAYKQYPNTVNIQTPFVSANRSGNSVDQDQTARTANKLPYNFLEKPYQRHFESWKSLDKQLQPRQNVAYPQYPNLYQDDNVAIPNFETLFVPTNGDGKYIGQDQVARTVNERPHYFAEVLYNRYLNDDENFQTSDNYQKPSNQDAYPQDLNVSPESKTKNTQSLLVSANGSGNRIRQSQSAENVNAQHQNSAQQPYVRYDQSNGDARLHLLDENLYQNLFRDRHPDAASKQPLTVLSKEIKYLSTKQGQSAKTKNERADIVDLRILAIADKVRKKHLQPYYGEDVDSFDSQNEHTQKTPLKAVSDETVNVRFLGVPVNLAQQLFNPPSLPKLANVQVLLVSQNGNNNSSNQNQNAATSNAEDTSVLSRINQIKNNSKNHEPISVRMLGISESDFEIPRDLFKNIFSPQQKSGTSNSQALVVSGDGDNNVISQNQHFGTIHASLRDWNKKNINSLQNIKPPSKNYESLNSQNGYSKFVNTPEISRNKDSKSANQKISTSAKKSEGNHIAKTKYKKSSNVHTSEVANGQTETVDENFLKDKLHSGTSNAQILGFSDSVDNSSLKLVAEHEILHTKDKSHLENVSSSENKHTEMTVKNKNAENLNKDHPPEFTFGDLPKIYPQQNKNSTTSNTKALIVSGTVHNKSTEAVTIPERFSRKHVNHVNDTSGSSNEQSISTNSNISRENDQTSLHQSIDDSSKVHSKFLTPRNLDAFVKHHKIYPEYTPGTSNSKRIVILESTSSTPSETFVEKLSKEHLNHVQHQQFEANEMVDSSNRQQSKSTHYKLAKILQKNEKESENNETLETFKTNQFKSKELSNISVQKDEPSLHKYQEVDVINGKTQVSRNKLSEMYTQEQQPSRTSNTEIPIASKSVDSKSSDTHAVHELVESVKHNQPLHDKLSNTDVSVNGQSVNKNKISELISGRVQTGASSLPQIYRTEQRKTETKPLIVSESVDSIGSAILDLPVQIPEEHLNRPTSKEDHKKSINYDSVDDQQSIRNANVKYNSATITTETKNSKLTTDKERLQSVNNKITNASKQKHLEFENIDVADHSRGHNSIYVSDVNLNNSRKKNKTFSSLNNQFNKADHEQKLSQEYSPKEYPQPQRNSENLNTQNLIVSAGGNDNSLEKNQNAATSNAETLGIFPELYKEHILNPNSGIDVEIDSGGNSDMESTTSDQKLKAASNETQLDLKDMVKKYPSWQRNPKNSNTQSLIVSAGGNSNSVSQNQNTATNNMDMVDALVGLHKGYLNAFQYPKSINRYPELQGNFKTSNKQTMVVSASGGNNDVSQNQNAMSFTPDKLSALAGLKQYLEPSKTPKVKNAVILDSISPNAGEESKGISNPNEDIPSIYPASQSNSKTSNTQSLYMSSSRDNNSVRQNQNSEILNRVNFPIGLGRKFWPTNSPFLRMLSASNKSNLQRQSEIEDDPSKATERGFFEDYLNTQHNSDLTRPISLKEMYLYPMEQVNIANYRIPDQLKVKTESYLNSNSRPANIKYQTFSTRYLNPNVQGDTIKQTFVLPHYLYTKNNKLYNTKVQSSTPNKFPVRNYNFVGKPTEGLFANSGRPNRLPVESGIQNSAVPYTASAIDFIIEDRVLAHRRFSNQVNKLLKDISEFMSSFRSKSSSFGGRYRKSLFDISNLESFQKIFGGAQDVVRHLIQVVKNVLTDLRDLIQQIMAQPNLGLKSVLQIMSTLRAVFGLVPDLIYKSLKLNGIPNNLAVS